jgi:hypothetical protein
MGHQKNAPHLAGARYGSTVPLSGWGPEHRGRSPGYPAMPLLNYRRSVSANRLLLSTAETKTP